MYNLSYHDTNTNSSQKLEEFNNPRTKIAITNNRGVQCLKNVYENLFWHKPLSYVKKARTTAISQPLSPKQQIIG